MSNIVFRTDGGSGNSIAMGHVIRDVKLAELLKREGHESFFLMRDYAEGVEYVRSHGLSVETVDKDIGQEEEAGILVNLAKSVSASVFFDMRHRIEKVVSACQINNIRSIVYEDVQKETLIPNVLINPTMPAKENPAYCKISGIDYFLGPEFQVLDQSISFFKKNEYSSNIVNLFLCFGGSDPCNISERVIKMLVEVNMPINITLVLGPGYLFREKLEGLIERFQYQGSIQIIQNCKTIFQIQSENDASIIAGGTMVYEAIGLNMPTLALPSINYEAENILQLITAGLIDGFFEDVQVGIGFLP